MSSSTPLTRNKFVYFGTPYVARDTLALLLERGYSPTLVVTNPDAPRGRGKVITPSETKAFALEKGLPVFTPDSLDAAAIAEIKKVGAEYALVVAYGKLFPQALIDSFPKGVINIHYSLLPKYRGASPVESALLHGDEVTGVSIQKMALQMDAGDLLAVKPVDILPTETTKELRPRLVEAGAHLLADILPEYLAGSLAGSPQDHALASRAKKIQKEEGELDLAGDARTNWNKYRAYAESPGTYFFEDGKRLKIKKASLKDGRFVVERVVREGEPESDYR